jgi:hypothetical protein
LARQARKLKYPAWWTGYATRSAPVRRTEMEFGLNFFPCLDPAQRSPEQYFSDVLHLTGLCD